MAADRRTPPGLEGSNGRLSRRIVGVLAPIQTMKILQPYVFFFFILIQPHVTHASHFIQDFPKKFHSACVLLHNALPVWIPVFQEFEADSSLLNAMVFPELMRYQPWIDKNELRILKLFYLPFGSKKADLSIGITQMKPSFAETLERMAEKEPRLRKFRSLFKTFKKFTGEKAREQRLKRLLDPYWQGVYLACFLQAAKVRFPEITTLTREKQLVFLASAYNGGLWRTKEQILKTAFLKRYPYGSAIKENPYSYTDTALGYFHHPCATEAP